LTADSEPGNNNEGGTNPAVSMAKGGGSDNEEEDTDDATVDDIDECGDNKSTSQTLTADSEPGNNNEDGTNNDGDRNNKNDNNDDDANEDEDEDDNRNEENERENEDDDHKEDEDEDVNENPPATKNNLTTSPNGKTPPPDSSTLDPFGGWHRRHFPISIGHQPIPQFPDWSIDPCKKLLHQVSHEKQRKSLRFIGIRSFTTTQTFWRTQL
jgi:hypothetical protein